MPLTLPEQNRYYRVISIDPGSCDLGVCIFEIDFYDRKIQSIDPFTIRLDKLLSLSGLDKEKYEGILYRLQSLKDHFSLLLQEKSPAMVLCESPFFNPRTPSAYPALLKVIQIIHNCVIDNDPNTFFHLVEPKLVKKNVGASLSSNKESVRTALMGKKDLLFLKSVDQWLSYDEHSIDAIAIGYGHLKC